MGGVPAGIEEADIIPARLRSLLKASQHQSLTELHGTSLGEGAGAYFRELDEHGVLVDDLHAVERGQRHVVVQEYALVGLDMRDKCHGEAGGNFSRSDFRSLIVLTGGHRHACDVRLPVDRLNGQRLTVADKAAARGELSSLPPFSQCLDGAVRAFELTLHHAHCGSRGTAQTAETASEHGYVAVFKQRLKVQARTGGVIEFQRPDSDSESDLTGQLFIDVFDVVLGIAQTGVAVAHRDCAGRAIDADGAVFADEGLEAVLKVFPDVPDDFRLVDLARLTAGVAGLYGGIDVFPKGAGVVPLLTLIGKLSFVGNSTGRRHDGEGFDLHGAEGHAGGLFIIFPAVA